MHVNYIFKDEMHFSDPGKQMLVDLYPQVFQDGVLNLELAKQLWEEEPDVALDRNYEFSWPGKSEAQAKAFQPDQSMTLVLDEDESKNASDTNNVYITGDNLSVLQTLYKSLRGQVSCIFIDPPYNTENDFIYDDDFSASEADILENNNLVSEQGRALLKTTKADRRHSKWLNMMYPRLQIAKTLLKDDGHIFITIDDNEITNLRMICNEIFGESRFVCQATWVSNKKGRKLADGASVTKEYILCYRKKRPKDLLIDQEWAAAIMPNIYTKPNYRNGNDDKGFYTLKNQLFNTNSKFNEETASTMVFDIFYNPNTHKFRTNYDEQRHKHPIQSTEIINPYEDEGYVYIPLHKSAKATHHYHAWRWSQDKVVQEPYNLVVDIANDGNHKIWSKVRGRKATHTGFKDTIMGPSLNTKQGSKDIEQLNQQSDGSYPLSDMFQFPKPVTLVQTLIESCTSGDDLILDFFSGSGTTAHAVLAANARDGEHRRFMVVQLPEQTYEIKKGKEVATKAGKVAYSAGYRSIDAIARERIRRIENTFEDNIKPQLDCGFQAYHIARSWQRPFPNLGTDQDNHIQAMGEHLDNPLRIGWTERALMTECLLKLREPVPHHISEENIGVYRVWYYSGRQHAYFGVFGHEITAELLKQLRNRLPTPQTALHVICLDVLVTDTTRQLAVQGNTNHLHFYLV